MKAELKDIINEVLDEREKKMTELISSNDPRYFAQTSDAPYDRHYYKVWCTDNSVKILQSWEEVQTAWWNFKHFYFTH